MIFTFIIAMYKGDLFAEIAFFVLVVCMYVSLFVCFYLSNHTTSLAGERKIWGSVPACAMSIFPGRVIPVT